VAFKTAVHDQQQSVSNPRDLAGTASSTSSGSVFRHVGCETEAFAALAARGGIIYQIQPSANESVRGIRTRSSSRRGVPFNRYPLEQEFRADLKAALRSDVNSREIAQRFGLVDF